MKNYFASFAGILNAKTLRTAKPAETRRLLLRRSRDFPGCSGMMIGGGSRRGDQEITHHSGVLVRKNVAVVNGLTGPLLEFRSDHRGRIHRDPDRILNRVWRDRRRFPAGIGRGN